MKKKGSFYRTKYTKLRYRLGSANKAKVAIANKLARVVYKIIAGDSYRELGYMRANPNQDKILKLVSQLKNLGVNIKHQNNEMLTSIQQIAVNSQTGEIIESTK